VYTPLHGSPTHSLLVVSMSDQNRARRPRFSVLQAKTAAQPNLSLPDCRHLNHLLHTIIHIPGTVLAINFHYQTNTECVALGFRFGRPKPPPTLDLAILASNHLNHLNHPTPNVPYTTSAGLNHPPPLSTATHSIFGFGRENPLPRPISCPPPCTCATTLTTPLHMVPAAPPQDWTTPHRYRVHCARYSVLGVKTPPPCNLKFPTSHRLNC
jgi:hypothetical protein